MAVSINTYFNPYRLSLKRRAPVSLTVEIINRGQEEKDLSLELNLTRQLALDKGGLKSSETKRLNKVQPNETKKFYFDIYQKQMTRPGEQPVIVKVLEHYQDYRYVLKEHKKKLGLKVED